MPTVPTESTPRPCTIANALEIVGDRWSLLVVRELFYDQRRFTDLARNTGAPRDILATRLRKLEEHGVITRKAYSAHPPRYEYRLSGAGRALSPVLLSLKRWGDKYACDGPPPVVFEHTCGATFKAEVHCAACGEPARAGSLTLTARRTQ